MTPVCPQAMPAGKGSSRVECPPAPTKALLALGLSCRGEQHLEGGIHSQCLEGLALAVWQDSVPTRPEQGTG